MGSRWLLDVHHAGDTSPSELVAHPTSSFERDGGFHYIRHDLRGSSNIIAEERPIMSWRCPRMPEVLLMDFAEDVGEESPGRSRRPAFRDARANWRAPTLPGKTAADSVDRHDSALECRAAAPVAAGSFGRRATAIGDRASAGGLLKKSRTSAVSRSHSVGSDAADGDDGLEPRGFRVLRGARRGRPDDAGARYAAGQSGTERSRAPMLHAAFDSFRTRCPAPGASSPWRPGNTLTLSRARGARS